MKRILITLAGVLILGFAALWLLLFTTTGNGLMKPWLEDYIQRYLPEARLDVFSINTEQTQVILSLSANARLEVDALTNIWQQSALGTWRFQATDLSELQALLPLALAGAISSEGRFAIADEILEVDGKVQLPQSLLNLHAQQTSASSSIQAQLTGDLALTDLWTLLQQPKFASGTLSVAASADIPRQEPLKLDGQVTLNIAEGSTHHQTINELTGLQIPQDQHFSLTSKTNIDSGNSLSNLSFISPLAQLDLLALRYTLGQHEIKTRHQTEIQDLTRLAFLTQIPLHGKMSFSGDAHINLASKAITASANSDTLGGQIKTDLVNQQIKARWKDLSVVELSRLLGMKPVFKSRLDGQLNYQIEQQKGSFSALLSDGQILPNEVSSLLNQAARFDITREVYKTVNISGNMDQKQIVADLDMQSRLTHITSQGARIDLSQQQLDMLLNVHIQGLKLPVRLQGDLISPAVSADLSSLLQQNFKQKTEKAAQESIHKEKEKLQQHFKLPKLF